MKVLSSPKFLLIYHLRSVYRSNNNSHNSLVIQTLISVPLLHMTKVIDSSLYLHHSVLRILLTFYCSLFAIYWPLFTVPLVTAWNSWTFFSLRIFCVCKDVKVWQDLHFSILLFLIGLLNKVVDYIELSRRFGEKSIYIVKCKLLRI